MNGADAKAVTDIAGAVKIILDSIGENGRPGLKDTPARVARTFLEMTSGLREQPPEITMFDAPSQDLITVFDLDFWSMCVASSQHINAVGGSKRASAVRVGDRLWTLKDGRAVETTVTEISVRYARELVEVETSEGKLQVTPDHPFATPSGWEEAQFLEGSSIEWTPARSLCRRRFEPKMGYSLGYAVGAMFSDGTVGDKCLSLVVNEEWFAERFSRHLDNAFGTESEIDPCSRPSGFTGKDTPGFRVRVVSSYLADLFRTWAGGDAHHMRQRFPRVVLNSQETMQGFLDGYVDGDGTPRPDRKASTIVSGNLPFLKELGEVLDSGAMPGKDGEAHRLYVSDNWHRKGWYGKHGFQQEDHTTELVESRYVSVLGVRKLDASGKKPFSVYSFKCDRAPTFLIQGHLSHNCEHHLVPFYGKCHIGYIPTEKIAGLSKFGRVLDHFAKRPQIQEVLTSQISKHLFLKLKAQGVIVVIEATHLCMAMRGIKKENHRTFTSSMQGDFPRAEFFDLLKVNSNR